MIQVFGNITNPIQKYGYGNLSDTSQGLIYWVNNLINLITALAGIFVIVNFIIAGYTYLSAGGQPQKISDAGNKILRSVIGIGIIAAAYLIAAVLGYLLFNNPNVFLSPVIYGPPRQ